MLSGSEYVNQYVIPRLFERPPSAEQAQAMIKAWDIILKHIEENLAIVTPAYQISTPPPLPTAAATPMTIAVSNGKKLNGTGGALAQKFVAQMLAGKQVPPETLQNLTNNFNNLFAHITASMEVAVSKISYEGTVAASPPFAFSGTSVTPTTGKGI